jgi:hypothetical protein
MMRFGALAEHYLSHASPTVDPERRQLGRDAIGFAAIAARLVHGRRTAAVIGLRSAAVAVNRRLAWMTKLARDLSAGHGTSYRLSRWMAGR